MSEYYQGTKYPEQRIYLITECMGERIPEDEVETLSDEIDEPGGPIIVSFICPSCGQTHRSKRVT